MEGGPPALVDGIDVHAFVLHDLLGEIVVPRCAHYVKGSLVLLVDVVDGGLEVVGGR